jgi:hypothetical protein
MWANPLGCSLFDANRICILQLGTTKNWANRSAPVGLGIDYTGYGQVYFLYGIRLCWVVKVWIEGDQVLTILAPPDADF